MAEKAQQGEPTRRSSRNVFPKRYDNGSDSAGSEGDVDFDDEEGTRRRGRPKKVLTPGSSGTGGKPKLDPADKKRGRPSKEIVWDDNYTGPLRRCAYIGHEDLWGPDVPVDLQPQYFYATTARCIYCYKHLCNERHANKSKDKTSTGKKKTGRGRRGDDDDDDDMDDDEDEVITPTASTRRGRAASRNKRSKGEDEWTGPSPRRPTPSQPRPTPVAAAANPPPNVLHNAETAQRNFLEGPRILQEWNAPPHATLEYSTPPEGAQSLQLKLASAPQQLDFARCLSHANQSWLINASPQASCVGWVSSDVLVIGGGSNLHVWSGLQTNTPSFCYTLALEGGGPVSSFIILPRSGVPKVRYAAVGAVHSDGKVRLHSLPIPNIVDQQPLMLRQLSPSPTSAPSTSRVHSLAVSTHPAHPNRLILGHEDGSLRWIDLPPNPGPELPPCQGNGGAGFSIASAGYLPTSDAAFWAVGDSASVAIGDIREPFGGPAAPPAANANTEAFLKTADSSVVFPALVAGGDGGHVWALPWAGEHTPPPRLLCSLNGAALSIRCHPFLPLAMAGCASGAARALWLPVQNAAHKSQQQLIVHAASAEDRNIVIDSPADLSDQGFRHSSPLSCVSVAWAPDVDGKYACVHANGLVRVGNVREFVLRSAK